MRVRLIKTIPKRRLWIISDNVSAPPKAGDLGETEQCYTGFWGPMVLVYFLSADGTEWMWQAEAYESEIEPVHGI